jgi:tRNA threonylcarbamoyladenosine biosynthesis protein TsaB
MNGVTQPRLLILETSGKVGQVALALGDRLLCTRPLDEARRHARDLVPAVADLLASQGWKPREVDGVIVSKGPGSYTGLRVGTMSAKAFAYATGCTVLGIPTFAAIALQSPNEAPALEVIADAQQDKVYVQRFVPPGTKSHWTEATPLAILKWEDWLGRRDKDTWVTGPGLHVYADRLPDHVRLAPAEYWDPCVDSLLQLGLERYRAGERDDLWALEPLYLRPSSAEEKWQTRQAP